MSQDFLENARILLKRRDLSAAITAFNRAEAAGACADSCAGGRWMAHMLVGNYTAAWVKAMPSVGVEPPIHTASGQAKT